MVNSKYEQSRMSVYLIHEPVSDCRHILHQVHDSKYRLHQKTFGWENNTKLLRIQVRVHESRRKILIEGKQVWHLNVTWYAIHASFRPWLAAIIVSSAHLSAGTRFCRSITKIENVTDSPVIYKLILHWDKWYMLHEPKYISQSLTINYLVHKA